MIRAGRNAAQHLHGDQYTVRQITALLLFGISVSGSASAETSAESRRSPEPSVQDERRLAARQHFDRGLAWANQHNYAQALQEFLEAYSQSPHYAVQYNIGQTYIALGLPVEAVAALERYLTEGSGQISDSRIQEVRTQIAAERARVAEVTVSVNVPNATVQIDGQEIGRAPLSEPVRVAAGSHVVAVSARDGTQLSRPVTLFGLEKLTLKFELPAASTPGPVSPATASSSLRTDRHDRVGALKSSKATSNTDVSTLGYALSIVGVALGAVALGDYLWNRGRYQQWRTTHEQLQSNPQAPDSGPRQIANNELADSIQNASYVTVGLSVASGLLTATGVTLVVLDRHASASTLRDPQERAMLLSMRGTW